MITSKNIIKHEMIGLWVKASPGPEGIIVDETKNTFTIDIGNSDTIIPKTKRTFTFKLPTEGEIEIAGDRMAYRPEDRTKKAR